MKLYKSKRLLNVDNNAKTIKGQKIKVMTAILYLAPAKSSGFNVCPMASKGCEASCLNTAGRGQMSSVQLGRINKTKWYFLERESFLIQLKKEIKNHVNRCKIKGYTPAVRLNGTSDISWEKHGLFELYPEVQFYDYTKIYKRALKWVNNEYSKNYHITYSLNEDNKKEVFNILRRGGNVSAVFRNKKLPTKFKGFKVINADKTDVRFKDPKNVIAGLYAKGKAKHDKSGFVLDI
tara:strand:+ start:15 stop:719 length:705 start_codon:yes stop_codon:yes gene_type:complete